MAGSKKDARKAEAMYREGRELALAGDYAQAVSFFDRAIDLHKGYAKAYFDRGACHYKLGQYARATDDINAASVLGCETAQFWSKHQRTTNLGLYSDEPE